MPTNGKRNNATKTFLYNITLGGFYTWKVCRIEDAAHQVYYVGERINYGGTVLADKEEDIKPQLEKQVPILNEFWSKVK